VKRVLLLILQGLALLAAAGLAGETSRQPGPEVWANGGLEDERGWALANWSRAPMEGNVRFVEGGRGGRAVLITVNHYRQDELLALLARWKQAQGVREP